MSQYMTSGKGTSVIRLSCSPHKTYNSSHFTSIHGGRIPLLAHVGIYLVSESAGTSNGASAGIVFALAWRCFSHMWTNSQYFFAAMVTNAISTNTIQFQLVTHAQFFAVVVTNATSTNTIQFQLVAHAQLEALPAIFWWNFWEKYPCPFDSYHHKFD